KIPMEINGRARLSFTITSGPRSSLYEVSGDSTQAELTSFGLATRAAGRTGLFFLLPSGVSDGPPTSSASFKAFGNRCSRNAERFSAVVLRNLAPLGRYSNTVHRGRVR